MADVTLKQRRLAAANSKWNVYYDHLADAAGNEVLDYIVIGSPDPRADLVTGICVLPVLDGRFVLIRCYRHALGKEMWEAPRGFLDPGEAPRNAALRELAEETGLHCAGEDLISLGHYAPEPSTMSARGALFVASACSGTLRSSTDEIGLLALNLFEPPEMAALIAAGAVEDAGTLIAYYQHRLLALRPDSP